MDVWKKRSAVSALGNRVRMIRRLKTTVSKTRNQNLPSMTPSSFDTLDVGMSAKESEELLQLETQKKILTNKLAQLTQEYQTEERKRRKLEEAVMKARTKANGAFQRTPENNDLHGKLESTRAKLEAVQQKYRGNLETLAEMRAHLDTLRRERYQSLPESTMSSSVSQDESEPEKSEEKQTIAKLTENDKAELLAYQKELEKHIQPGQRPQSSLIVTGRGEEGQTVVQRTDKHLMMIQSILDMLNLESLPELFSEAERLEKENAELYKYITENDEAKHALEEEIAQLETQYRELMTERESNEDEQRNELNKLNAEIADVQSQLAEIETQKNKDEMEFSEVYSEIEQLFNALECSWDDSPDEMTNVTTQNVMFALSTIESTVAELMSDVAKEKKADTQ